MADLHNIAIAGLGRVGGTFLSRMLKQGDKGVAVVAVAEPKDTEGRRLAQEKGIPVVTLGGLVDMGHKVDIVFDLSGDQEVREEIEQRLAEKLNKHTVVANAGVARLVFSLVCGECLPEIHNRKHQKIADALLARRDRGED